MATEQKPPEAGSPEGVENTIVQKRRLSPAAERALAEAAARRAEHDRHPADRPKETGGPNGPEPTRYGDWEVNGLASDF